MSGNVVGNDTWRRLEVEGRVGLLREALQVARVAAREGRILIRGIALERRLPQFVDEARTCAQCLAYYVFTR